MNQSKLETTFIEAASRGFLKPRLSAHGFTFKLAPAHGANPNNVYVTDSDTREYLGKIKDGVAIGKFNQAARDLIATIASNPQEEAIKWGHETGQCAICGRHLDNAQSVALGIGPICNEKFGWSLPHLASNASNQDLIDLL
jgi:hypothetical protein